MILVFMLSDCVWRGYGKVSDSVRPCTYSNMLTPRLGLAVSRYSSDMIFVTKSCRQEDSFMESKRVEIVGVFRVVCKRSKPAFPHPGNSFHGCPHKLPVLP